MAAQIGPGKTPIFPWQRPLENQKKLNGVIKPFQLSTNPEILVKIGPIGGASEATTKKIIKTKEKTSVK